MSEFTKNVALQALELLGNQLRGRIASVRIMLVGGAAGLLTDVLAHKTIDCDAMRVDPEDQWDIISGAVAEVGEKMGLSKTWLNQECKVFASAMPLGWIDRCIHIGTFGPLQIYAADRVDLVVSKIFGAAKRSQDREDVMELRPTSKELQAARETIERLELERPDDYSKCLKLIEALEVEHEPTN